MGVSSSCCRGQEAEPADVVAGDSVEALAPHPEAVVAEAHAARNLQELFEVLPPRGVAGWMGADSDVTVVIGGGSTGKRVLWIFADTFIAGYNPFSMTRIEDGFAMPHNTLGLMEIEQDGSVSPPDFVWQVDAQDQPVSFFEPLASQKGSVDVLWPVSAIASRDGASVLMLATQISGFMNVVGTTGIVIRDVATIDDPRQWKHTMFDMGNKDLTWFSGIFYAESEGDTVYLLGHKEASQTSPTVVARARLSLLLECDWEHVVYWTAPGLWSKSAENLQGINLPSWETTCTWSKELGLWYSFNIPALSSQVFLWTAEEVTGTWTSVKVFDIPSPFDKGPWISYAAKAHPELEHIGGRCRAVEDKEPSHTHCSGEATLVFTYVSNVLSDSQLTSPLFEAGAMAMSRRGYWPRFVRVHARRPGAEVAPSPTLLASSGTKPRGAADAAAKPSEA